MRSLAGVIGLFFRNDFYNSQEECLFAIAEAMRHEYEAVAKADIVLQIDCPDLAMGRHILRYLFLPTSCPTTPPTTAPAAVPSTPPPSTAPPTPPIPAPIAVLRSCFDIPAQPPRPSISAMTTALTAQPRNGFT